MSVLVKRRERSNGSDTDADKVNEQLAQAMAISKQERALQLQRNTQLATEHLQSLSALRPVFYEDPTFRSIHHPYDQARCRAWRYRMELSFGRYNAELGHRCSRTTCLMPDDLSNSDDQDVAEGYIHTIDSHRRLYGCPRSGSIHQCGFDQESRVLTCHYNPHFSQGNYLPCETESGAIICMFSGLQVQPDALVYEPRNDRQKHASTAPIVRGVIAKRSEETREITKRMDVNVKRAVVRVKAEVFSKKRTAQESAAIVEETARELRRMKLRSRSPKRSLKQMEDSDSSESGSPNDSAPNSPKRQRIKITHSINGAKWITIAGDYRILEADWVRIQNAIDYLLFDPAVRRDARDFPHSPLRCSAGEFPKPLDNICALPPGHKISLSALQLRNYYTARCALVYAVVKNAQFKDSRSKPRRQGTRAARKKRKPRTKGQNGNRSIDLKNAHSVYVILRVLAKGIQHWDTLANMAAGRLPDESVIVTEVDERLEKALPSESQVRFYGLQKKVRCDIFANSVPDNLLQTMTAYRFDPQLFRAIQSGLDSCQHPSDHLANLFIEAAERFTYTRQLCHFEGAKRLHEMEGELDPIDEPSPSPSAMDIDPSPSSSDVNANS